MISFKQHLKNTLNEEYTVTWTKDGDPRTTKELKVSDVQFSRAYRYLSVSGTAEEETINILTKVIGLPEKVAKQIVAISLQYDNAEAFFNAVKSRSDITEIINSGNVLNFITSKYGINREFAEALLLYQPATQPVSGKGEIFLLIFSEGATKVVKKNKNDTTSGDISVNGVIYEIKGTGAILRGQKGFGTAKAAIAAWHAGLTKLAQKANIQLPAITSYTIGPDSAGPIDNLVSSLMASGKVTREDIIDLYVDGFSKMYDAADPGFINEWVDRGLDQNGKMNKEFLMNYFIFAIQYYAMQEHFNYLVSIVTKAGVRNNGNVSYISSDQILDNNNITSHIMPAAYGSITPNVGVQSSWLGIKPVVA